MTLGSFRFGLRFATFSQNTHHYYSDWQYVQALARVITGVIVIARQVSWSPKMLDGRWTRLRSQGMTFQSIAREECINSRPPVEGRSRRNGGAVVKRQTAMLKFERPKVTKQAQEDAAAV
jgi:hypothetical protein